MKTEILVAVIALVGVSLGSAMTFLSSIVQKKIERNSQVHKLISEKRFEAYEALIASVKWCKILVGRIKNDEYMKYSQIFQSTDDYDKWVVGLTVIQNRFSHLLHKKLSEKLHILNLYIYNLNNLLDETRDENGQFVDIELIQEIGASLHDDMRKLSSDILREASYFYSTEIYSPKFNPSISSIDDEENSAVGEEIMQMNLYSKRPEIRNLINQRLVS